jgi:hypothetical protein
MAFPGWQNAYVGTHYDARLRDGAAATTKFFVRDHEDLRGEGPASPAWLASQVVAQPEFATCMATKVAHLVYEGHPPPLDVLDKLSAEFADGQRMERLIGSAVIARFLGAGSL